MVLLAVTAVLWGRWAAVGGAQEASPHASPDGGDGTPRVALLVPRPEEPFWQTVEGAVLEEAVALDVGVDVFRLASPSAVEQLDQVTAAVEAGYDGILLGPVDAVAAVPAIDVANAAEVPVVVLDAAPPAGEVVAVVATDREAAAAAAARFVGEAIDGQGRVLLLGGPADDPVAAARDRGLRSGLAEFPDIEVVGEAADWDPELAAVIAGERLPPADVGTPSAGDPELRAIIAATDDMALAAADVALLAGRGEIVVVGFGGTPDAITAVDEGWLAATVAEAPITVGQRALDAMVRHLDGEPGPGTIDAGSRIISADDPT